MVSTPSRSSAAPRISLPCIVGPTSARSGAAAGFGSIVVVLLMLLGALWPVIAGKEKPTTVASRGLLAKSDQARQGPAARSPATTTTRFTVCSADKFISVKAKQAAKPRSSTDSALNV